MMRSLVDRSLPILEGIRLRKGIDGDEDFSATVVGVLHGVLKCPASEIKAGEMTCVGLVSKADINRVSTVVYSSFE